MAHAPQQQQMWDHPATIGMSTEETFFMRPPGAGVEDTYFLDRQDLTELVKMFCCPCCCVFVPWVSAKNKMKYSLDVKCCCDCTYKTELNGRFVGRTRGAGCCDNGWTFCLCPCLTCSGKVKLVGVEGHDGAEHFVFAKSIFPCWPLVQCLAQACGCTGLLCASMIGCYHYITGEQIKTITQPVYKGPWSRTGGTEPQKVGEFVTSQRFHPVTWCCAVPRPMQYYFKPTTADGTKIAETNLAALSMMLQIYRGMPAPCKMCSSCAEFQKPYGVSCLDVGLDTETSWQTVQQVLMDSHGRR